VGGSGVAACWGDVVVKSSAWRFEYEELVDRLERREEGG